MHGYAHFAEFGNPINSAVRPPKKPNAKRINAIQTHTQCAFGLRLKMKIILLFNLFLLLSCVPLHILALFMSHTVLFQLIFTFIYNTFSNNFLVLTK